MRASAMVIGLAVSALLTGCESQQAATPATVQAAVPAPSPSRPAAAADNEYVSSGPLVVEDQVDVSAQRMGVVAKVHSEVGQHVKKGQLLVELDDRQIRAERDAAAADLQGNQANLDNWQAHIKVLESDYQRDQELWKAQLITAQQLEHSKYTLDAAHFEVTRDQQNVVFAREKLRAAELELEKTRILSPFDGVVGRRYIREGQKVAVNDRMFWVSAMAPLQVRFTLPQEFVGKVRDGQQIALASLADPQARHEARITAVSPVVDPSSGTFEVVARVEGTPAGLLPGMTVNIRIPKTQ